MSDYNASTYGDRLAQVYDRWFGNIDAEAAVDQLAELAGGGPALELAIGTGRVALPLVERGHADRWGWSDEQLWSHVSERPVQGIISF